MAELKFSPETIETVAITDLRPYERNPRTHSPDQVSKIAASMLEFGWTVPVMIDDRNEIIAGHGRVMAATQLGIQSVPAIRMRHLSPEQVSALRIADNQITILGDWDIPLLSAETLNLGNLGFDLDVLGFDGSMLAQLLTPNAEGLTDADDAPEITETAVSGIGDLWLLDNHRLLCGDITDHVAVTTLTSNAILSLAITSPPYNQKIDTFKPSGMHKEHDWVSKVGRLAYADNMPEAEYQQQQRSILQIMFGIMNDNSSFFYNHKNRYRDKKVVSPFEWIPTPFSLRQEIIWKRPGSVTQNARMFLPCDERIYWMYKGNDFTFNDTTDIKTWSTVWDILPKTNKTHAVAFPVEIPIRCINACTSSSQLIIDPFVGSGTTIIAAQMTGRTCLAMEISPQYVDVAVKRWQAFTGQSATLDDDGRTFDEIAAERTGARDVIEA